MPGKSPIATLVADKLAEHDVLALREAARQDSSNRAAYIAARRAYKADLQRTVRAQWRALGALQGGGS